jgi:hypothetical protein
LIALLIVPVLLTGTDEALGQGKVLDAPRASGAVGESFNGYAVVRNQGDAQLNALVADVNAQRRQVYEQRAKAENVPVEQIARVYAQQIINGAPKGTWILRENGQWVQK